MFPVKIKTCIQLIVLCVSVVRSEDRKLYSTLNPGCDDCTKNETLMYTKAVGSQDTIHQIWDFTCGVPTVIIAVAGNNSTVNITWTYTTPTDFRISEKPKYVLAAAIEKIYEYNDVHDRGFIDESSPRRGIPLRQATWKRKRSERSSAHASLGMRAHFHPAGHLDMALDLLPYEDYAVELPHLIHSSNSTLLDVGLVNLTTSASFNSSRFALQLHVISLDRSNSSLKYTMRKSLDDEHTPGVFEMVEVTSPRGSSGGFLQFRPVAYTSALRSVGDSTAATLSAFNRSSIPDHSTLQAFFRKFDSQELLVQDMLLSMGMTGDGFYHHYNYTAWSATIGYGSPPIEGFSPFVIGLIACGLGAPALLGILGAVFACCRRRPTHSRLQEQ